MTLFDIRTDDSHVGFIGVVNQGLDSEPGNAYLSRFGHVCSPHWWACFDRGEFSVKVLSGDVIHSGARIEEWTGEEEDVIEFLCGEQVVGYDRVGCWVAPICVGDRISVTHTVAELATRTGLVTYIIDLWAEWWPVPTEENHAEPSVVSDCGGIT